MNFLLDVLLGISTFNLGIMCIDINSYISNLEAYGKNTYTI